MEAESRITVEPLELADCDVAARWLSDPQINKWLASGWRGRQVDAKMLATLRMNRRNRVFLVRADGAPCGLVSLGCIDPTDRTALMWYVLGERALGSRGIITEAVRQVVRIAFSELGLASIQASAMEPNRPSQRVLEKAGFRLAGRLRRGFVLDGRQVDRLIYDLVGDDPAAKT